ncbi:hypothetical protein [Loigolactobacillus zhaoyuanensis]|uniref:hypothetical protein n=1 Tax=Loigolactobacillus zhaoyuanensis TaxID=2486017 RepID=UPI0036D872F9
MFTSSLMAVTTNTKIAVGIGVIIFVLLFFKLMTSFIKFCFRHPILFLFLLLCGGLGFIFNFLLAGIAIVAVLIGGGALVMFNSWDQ